MFHLSCKQGKSNDHLTRWDANEQFGHLGLLKSLQGKLKDHLATWDANEQFGIWDRNILHFALGFEDVERIRIILDNCDVSHPCLVQLLDFILCF